MSEGKVLAGKVAIVTGGGRGIGRASAELFAAEGASVIVGDLDVGTPFDVEQIEVRRLDVTDESSWQELVTAVVERYGRVDVLMNNAGGVGSYEPIDSIALNDASCAYSSP